MSQLRQEAVEASATRAFEQPADCCPLPLKFPSCVLIPYGPILPILHSLAQVLPPAGSLPGFMQPSDISLSSQFP